MRGVSSSLRRDLLGRILAENRVEWLYEGLVGLLEELVERYRPLAVIVAGSLARGEFVYGLSDIDVLVVVEGAVDGLERFQLRAVDGVDVEVTIVPLGELVVAVESGNQFYTSALCEGVVVYGGLCSVSRLKGALGCSRRGWCG